MPKICQIYAKDKLQIQDNYLKQIYAKDISGVILRLKIQENFLKKRYANNMPKIHQKQLPITVVKLPKI